MNREGAQEKSPEEMYIQQKVRVLLMLRKMGSNLTPSEEAFLRTYAGVVNSQLSQLPQHPIDQDAARPTAEFLQHFVCFRFPASGRSWEPVVRVCCSTRLVSQYPLSKDANSVPYCTPSVLPNSEQMPSTSLLTAPPNNDESKYRREMEGLMMWCNNNLSVNVNLHQQR
ncbi:beta-catenin-interacting protein 1 isoform X2 [Chiloscyllium plagiosum]|nr:beta-catenin-interacting protein 1 isoform X2 [Chiloscyllium plagiosum]XP_043532128.1 beta-catenin-interacting protein 1 isoform X2 [Chiloscyllium plagiosum]